MVPLIIIPIIALITTAIAAGALIIMAAKLTISVLKKYRQKKNSKVVAAAVKDLIKQAPTMKLGDLDDDDIILAEYDEETDELVQDISVAKDVDYRVKDILNANGGIVVFE